MDDSPQEKSSTDLSASDSPPLEKEFDKMTLSEIYNKFTEGLMSLHQLSLRLESLDLDAID
jgi:hypothetical protein